ncbi:MAG: macro domain-containing protein [Clostridia bacterium]|nr:macro domain-containing protein [Clostridia bacterium]
MPFEIVRNNIVNMQVDAIVNTANPKPVVGAGTDAAIHEAAGPKLMEERKKIGSISPGDAALTKACQLPAKYVIHVVGPVWTDGSRGEADILAACYRNALALALQKRCKSVAFPLISTGTYGFPKDLALQVAIREIGAFLLAHDMQVYLVVFNREAFQLSEKLFSSVQSFIDENYVAEQEEKERTYQNMPLASRDYSLGAPLPKLSAAEVREASLEDMLEHLDAGFSETLLQLIDRTGRKDSEIYKKANVDRKLFSKIRNNPGYRPSKTTAVAFAMALELDLDETQSLIGRAGYTLTHSSLFDIIVEYFIREKNYDINELNTVLFRYDQSLIGC